MAAHNPLISCLVHLWQGLVNCLAGCTVLLTACYLLMNSSSLVLFFKVSLLFRFLGSGVYTFQPPFSSDVVAERC